MPKPWYLALSGNIPDEPTEGAPTETELLDAFAKVVAEGGQHITSASFTGPSVGMVNLHDHAASDATHVASETPAETGPAASGVGMGTEGPPPAGGGGRTSPEGQAGDGPPAP